MDANFAECLRLYQSGKSADCISGLINFLADQPNDPDAKFLLALVASCPSPSDSLKGVFDNLLLPDRRTADDYERVGHGLRDAGLKKLAEIAFKTAAARDRENPERQHSWGDKPFNGQERRVTLFQELLKQVNIEAVVETGTFRGSTTLFFRESTGVDVYSCELSDRNFEYASAYLASHKGIHLYKGDSRDFLSQLSEDSAFRSKTVFFYLDAHWNADLPLAEELQLIFQHFESPIIMIDDFEVPHRGDYEFDDYGENAILSVDMLEPIVTADLSLIYPTWSLAGASGPQRGFVILAKGEIARRIGTLSEHLRQFDGFHAALQQMKRYRQMFRQVSSGLEGAKVELQQANEGNARAKAELQQANVELQQANEGNARVKVELQQASVELQQANEGNARAKVELQQANARIAELERFVDAVQQSSMWRGTQWLSKEMKRASSLWRR